MNDTFQCPDKTALVEYLYDEGGAEDREAIAAHVARCLACAEEVSALRTTRLRMATWTPPAASLGFRIGPEHVGMMGDSEEGALPPVLSVSSAAPPSWWQRPLPAWAQLAAAVLIFAVGLGIGSAGAGSDAASRVATPAQVTSVAPATTVVPGAAPRAVAVTTDDLAELERRLRAEVEARAAAPAVRSASDDEQVLRRVRTLVEQSEERQRRELALRTAEILRDVDAQRRFDLAQLQGRVQQIQTLTGAEVRDQRRALNYVLSSLQGRN